MFFETIKLLNGHLHNLSYHQDRINRTRKFYYNESGELSLSEILPLVSEYTEGLFKVRVDYGLNISKVSIEPYKIKTHQRLKILEIGDFDYSFKYTNRDFFISKLNEFLDFDDILFTRNGFLTDTTYCNLALFDGKEWVTPSTFLLPGIKRCLLLANEKIKEQQISLRDLGNYRKICFINAMRDFEKSYTFVINQDEILLTKNEP